MVTPLADAGPTRHRGQTPPTLLDRCNRDTQGHGCWEKRGFVPAPRLTEQDMPGGQTPVSAMDKAVYRAASKNAFASARPSSFQRPTGSSGTGGAEPSDPA